MSTLEQTLALMDQARQLLALEIAGQGADPVISQRDLERVLRVGEVAHRHLEYIEENGDMTLGKSLAIRRAMFGERVQATANLFGTRDSGAILYRDRPYGTPRRDDDPVALTDEGHRVATLWRLSQERQRR